MTSTEKGRERQRGVALLMALLALLLLSAIGLGMMYSTGTDTVINANYRDKQLAMYASMAGVQEARDRIQPVNTVAAIAVATDTASFDLPSTSAANVVYIINPGSGETVAPWNTGNVYFDTELCQENVLGLSGSNGVPCTASGSGSGWYTTVDNSQSSSAPWNLTSPLQAKWTRITLKGNNMTPVPVNGNSATSTQVCWDGHRQIVRPSGYNYHCAPISSSVATITLTNPGSGYTSAPTVSLTGGGGSGAAASVIGGAIPNGQVGSVTVTAPGSNYTSAPTVTFSGGGGSGAAATAAIQPMNGRPVASLNLTSAGQQCYVSASPPSVTITGGGGKGASGTATVAAGANCLYSLQVTANCKKNQTVAITISGGDGSGATVGTLSSPNGSGSTVTVSGSPVVVNPGSGYSGSTLTVTAGTTSPNVDCTNVTSIATFGNVVQSLNLIAGGTSYTSEPAVALGGGAGSGVAAPTATSTLGAPAANAGQVIAVNVTAGGSGYATAPTVVFSGGSGSGAAATAELGSTYTITGVNVTDGGSGYTSAPAVSFSGGGGGSGALAYASLAQGLVYGQVFLLTSLGQTVSGARAMTQMEVATPVRGISLTGALTLDGPNPSIGTFPNSSPFFINGNDANSCGQTASPAHPAIGGYDDPNANPLTNSVGDITAAIPSGRTNNYLGSGPSPDVQNVFGSLGDTMSSPSGLWAFAQAVRAAAGPNVFGNNPGSIPLGSSASPQVVYVDGNLTLGGSNTGYGILLVTGTVSFGGNFSWNGLVLVIGNGVLDFNGGGSGQINGSVIVAKIWDNYTTKNLLSAVGSPSLNWVGGGGNGIYYDHCWADNMLAKIPFTPPPSNKQLKILSTRTLSY